MVFAWNEPSEHGPAQVVVCLPLCKGHRRDFCHTWLDRQAHSTVLGQPQSSYSQGQASNTTGTLPAQLSLEMSCWALQPVASPQGSLTSQNNSWRPPVSDNADALELLVQKRSWGPPSPPHPTASLRLLEQEEAPAW